MKQAARDGRLELLRFAFCLLIVCFHSFLVAQGGESLFPYAYIFVEFFFCLSGYFAVRRFRKAESAPVPGTEARTALAYSAKRLVPIWICSFAIVFVRSVWTWLAARGGVVELGKLLVARFPEAALLNAFLPVANYCTPPLWYAAALLVALPVFVYLLLRLPDLFSHLMLWMLPLFTYGVLLGRLGTLQSVYFFIPAILRALAGLCLGGCVYAGSEWLKGLKPNRFLRILLSLLALCGLLGVILLAFGRVSGRHDGLAVALLFLFLCALLSDQTFLRPFSGPVSGFLGAITLPMYVTQYLAGELVARYLPLPTYGLRLLCMLGLTVALALPLYAFVRLVRRIDFGRLFLSGKEAA